MVSGNSPPSKAASSARLQRAQTVVLLLCLYRDVLLAAPVLHPPQKQPGALLLAELDLTGIAIEVIYFLCVLHSIKYSEAC